MHSLILPLFNFVVYLVVGVILYRKFGAPALRARAVVIEEHIKKSSQALANVETELVSLREQLSQISSDKEEVLRQLNEDGEHTAKAVVERAKETALALKDDLARRVESEFKQATKEVRNEAVIRATAKAKSLIESQLTPEKDAQMRRNTVRGLL